MKYFFIFILPLFYVTAYSQTFSKSYSIGKQPVILKAEMLPDGFVKYKIYTGIEKTDTLSFNINTDDIDTYAYIFWENIKKWKMYDSALMGNEENIKSISRKIFLDQHAYFLIENTAPHAGLLRLYDTVNVYSELRYVVNMEKIKKFISSDTAGKPTSNNSDYLNIPKKSIQKPDNRQHTNIGVYARKIIEAQLEINNGFIQNMKVLISNPITNKVLTFTAPFPIGISSVSNYNKYRHLRLVLIGTSPVLKDLYKNVKVPADKIITHIDSSVYIFLSDVIDYNYFLGTERRDYSPKDTSLIIKGGEAVLLKKEETKKLFEAKIYSDFIGLNSSKPNGLIQAEIQKRININTTQKLAGWNWIRNNFFKSYGFFNYISPIVSFTKIEENNRRLILSDLDSLRMSPGETDTSKFNKNINRYTSLINVYKHQWFSAGFDLNVVYISNHDSKWDMAFNAGVRVGITYAADSTTNINNNTTTKTGFVNEFSIPFLQIFPEMKVRFLPEERFSFCLINKFMYTTAFAPNLQVISHDKQNFNKIKPYKSGWIYSPELLFSINISEKTGGKMFGRIRFNNDMRNTKDNFAQIQVGYATYILGRSN